MPNDKEYDATIKLRITSKQLSELKAYCARKGIPVSEYIRTLIAKGIQSK